MKRYLRFWDHLIKGMNRECYASCFMYKALIELCVDLQIKDEESKSATLDRPGFLLLHKNLK
jgi:hypothetical protein